MRRVVEISLMVLYTLGILTTASAVVLEKDYIGIGANDYGLFTIGVPVPGVTDTGCPENIKDLTCCDYCNGGGTGLGHAIFKIDGEYFSNDTLMLEPNHLELVRRTENVLDLHLRTMWEAGDIQITQLLVPIDMDSDIKKGTVRIQYSIANTGSIPHEVGLLLNMDLKIGSSGLSDMARFRFPTGVVVDTTAILELAEIPPFWDSRDPGDTTFKARGVLGVPPNVRPDRLAIGEARLLTAVLWEPYLIPIGEPYDDSGIIYLWYPRTLNPGEILNIVTTYGKLESPPPPPPGRYWRMMVEGSRRFGFYDCGLLPNPFTVTFVPANVSLYNIEDARATISFNNPMIGLREGEVGTKPLAPATIGAGFSGITYWIAEIIDPPVTSDAYCEYTIELTSTIDTCESDSIECCVYDTCTYVDTLFVPASSYEGPVAEVNEPLYSTITSDPHQPTMFEISDLEGVNPSTIWVRHLMGASDLLFRIDGDSIVVLEGDSLIIFHPERCPEIASYSDGNRPVVQLIEAMDVHGCALGETLTTRFLVDLTAPRCPFHGYGPAGDTLWDSLFVAWINIYDNLGHVDTNSIELGINKLSDHQGTYTISHDALYYHEDDIYVVNDTLYIDPEAAGIHWDDGVVEICPVHCADKPDYGIPNAVDDTAYCFSFTVNAHGPRAYTVEPRDGDCTSNPEQQIIFKLIDGNGILPSSVLYTVQGDTFGVASTDDTIITWIPPVPWEDLEEVEVRILSAEDDMGIPIDLSHAPDYSFLVDLTPPALGDHLPTEGEIIGTVRPLITIPIIESGCGVDTASFVLTINGESWLLSHPAAWWDNDERILCFDVAESDLDFNSYDTVEVCVTVADAPTIGDANVGGSYCWTFYIAAENPEAWFVTGNYICDPEPGVRILLTDPDGVDASTILLTALNFGTMETDEFTLADAELRYFSDTLTWTPSAPLENGDSIEVCLNEMEDIFGYALDAPVCQRFFIDLDAPFFIERYTIFENLTPGPIADTTVHIFIDTGDSTGSIDEATVHFIANGIEYTTDSEALSLIDGHLVRFIPAMAGLDYHLYDWWECFLYVGSYCDYGSNIMDPPYHFWFWYFPTPGIDDDPKKPCDFSLQQNYPNPFNAQTTIAFTLPVDGNISLEIYDLLGRRIKELVGGERKAGMHVILWDGTDFNGDPAPSGGYFYRLKAGDKSEVKQMWMIK
ncbi:T9SS type A sorting domain-containing protein [bacterium]|nr:T9SS type A sorting domain-containing protein [bacterium]